jgi:hypothetical protein
VAHVAPRWEPALDPDPRNAPLPTVGLRRDDSPHTHTGKRTARNRAFRCRRDRRTLDPAVNARQGVLGSAVGSAVQST